MDMDNKEITTDGDYTIYPISKNDLLIANRDGIPQYYMSYDRSDDHIHIGLVTKSWHKAYVERNCEGIIAHETMHKILYHIISNCATEKLDNNTFFKTFGHKHGRRLYRYKTDQCGFTIPFLRHITHKQA